MKKIETKEYDLFQRSLFLRINNKQRHRPTRKEYKQHVTWFIEYLMQQKITPQMVDKAPVQCIQQYVDYLVSSDRETPVAPNTAHSYITAICAHYGLSIEQIKKPKREILESKKIKNGMAAEQGGKVTNARGKKEEKQARFQRLVAFQRRVGIRRAELGELTMNNFKVDESGAWCVEVMRGKCGKYQLQRLLPEDVIFVREYFDIFGDSTDLVFKKEEISNDINLHALRSIHARDAYGYYKNLTQNNPEERVKLQMQLLARFFRYNKSYALTKNRELKERKLKQFIKDMTGITIKGKPHEQREQLETYLNAVMHGVILNEKSPLNPKNVSAQYTIRGDSKIVADAFGRDHDYDRLALMAVSVFHLAHWRNDVTVRHYMLAA